MAIITLTCSQIECSACAIAIKRSLGRLEGVDVVDVDFETKTVNVRFNNAMLSTEKIRARLTAAGYEPS